VFAVYAVALFTVAVLLFWIQPLSAKIITPHLGWLAGGIEHLHDVFSDDPGGGLLVAVAPGGEDEFDAVTRQFELEIQPIGALREQQDGPFIEVV
jgi:hypothetical protein